MTTLDLDESPVVVTVGAAMFADAVTSQAAQVIPVDWMPPARARRRHWPLSLPTPGPPTPTSRPRAG